MRNNKKYFQTLGNATINRYFEVGTIIRINRLKPVNCSTKCITVALIKLASMHKFAHKSAPKEKS